MSSGGGLRFQQINKLAWVMKNLLGPQSCLDNRKLNCSLIRRGGISMSETRYQKQKLSGDMETITECLQDRGYFTFQY